MYLPSSYSVLFLACFRDYPPFKTDLYIRLRSEQTDITKKVSTKTTQRLSAVCSDTHPDLPNSQPGGWLTFDCNL